MKNIFCIFRLHLQNLPTVASSECMTKKETTKTDCLFFITFQKLIPSNDFFFVVRNNMHITHYFSLKRYDQGLPNIQLFISLYMIILNWVTKWVMVCNKALFWVKFLDRQCRWNSCYLRLLTFKQCMIIYLHCYSNCFMPHYFL